MKNKRMESFLLSCFVSARACMYAYVPTDDTCPLHPSGENECRDPSFLGCRTNGVEFASCQY